mmetsp:Transcript_9955/g.28983  ORF Transcript_9955/g.28983 Transcript_9955/m.28983 type:complete len:206 (+) Transcript_9955:1056-1673(+)
MVEQEVLRFQVAVHDRRVACVEVVHPLRQLDGIANCQVFAETWLVEHHRPALQHVEQRARHQFGDHQLMRSCRLIREQHHDVWMPELLQHLHLQFQVLECSLLLLRQHVGTDGLARDQGATPEGLMHVTKASRAYLFQKINLIILDLERACRKPSLSGGRHTVQWLLLLGASGDDCVQRSGPHPLQAASLGAADRVRVETAHLTN